MAKQGRLRALTCALTTMIHLLQHPARHPSALLFFVQIAAVLLHALFEGLRHGPLVLDVLGLFVLGLTTHMVRRTPGQNWMSAGLAATIVALLVLRDAFGVPGLQVWTSALEAVFYFHAAASLISYMMEDDVTTADELYAAAATFTLLAWAFTHLFFTLQELQPRAFIDAGDMTATPRTWSELNHLSFALLSSTGMGSVVAVSPLARALASLEMMVGLMYLAGVVSRLVGFTMRPRAQPPAPAGDTEQSAAP